MQLLEQDFLVVKHTFYKIVGWSCIVLFTICSAVVWRIGATYGWLFFLLFAALGLCIVLCSGSMKANAHFVKYQLPFRRYEIRWDEIKRVEMDKQSSNIILVGDNKRLAVNGFAAWCGKDKAEMIELFRKQIRERGIEFRQTETAMLRLSKNTRVRA